MIHTPGEPTVEITESDVNPPYHYYNVTRTFDLFHSEGKDAVLLPAESLLELAQYVEANRSKLEQEAAHDQAKHQKAWDSEMSDMAQIDREWRKYRSEE